MILDNIQLLLSDESIDSLLRSDSVDLQLDRYKYVSSELVRYMKEELLALLVEAGNVKVIEFSREDNSISIYSLENYLSNKLGIKFTT